MIVDTFLAGLILLAGTEKKMFISENEIEENKGKFMMEIDITSHRYFTFCLHLYWHTVLSFCNVVITRCCQTVYLTLQ